MGDKPTPTVKPDAGAYELDLDAEGNDVDEVMRSALDAVEKRQRVRPENGGAAGDPAGEEPSGKSDDENASDEVAALKTQLLRTLADFDNFRKRTEREKETLRRFAVSEVIKEVLGVVDNLERAHGASGTIEELKLGLEMVLRQQADVMKRFGVQTIETVGRPFDPGVHEAVASESSPEVKVPTVVRELQKGYTIHDRLLRPAMVYVAMPAAGAPKSAAGATDGSGDQSADSE